MRAARTMATNGGPVFVFLDVAGRQSGDTIVDPNERVPANVEVRSLNELRAVELYQDGARVAAFNVQGQKGTLLLQHEILTPRDRPSWLVARAEDKHGKWCLTSPVFFSPGDRGQRRPQQDASAILLEISNATRFVELRPQFFAHVIVTVGRHETLKRIELLRGNETLHAFRPEDGDQIADDQTPVTSMPGPYAPGWVWYPRGEHPFHFQADWPIAASGWYTVAATTETGRKVVSDAVLFEASNPASHSLSTANLANPFMEFSLWGYGEEVPLAELRPPFDQGEWWYPRNVYWRVRTRFGDQQTVLGWPSQQPVERFRD